jgi:hypothetical protein
VPHRRPTELDSFGFVARRRVHVRRKR